MLVYITVLMFLLCLFSKCTVQSADKNISTDKLLRKILRPKVVNGEAAQLGEIPYQVAFKTPLYGKSTYYTFCGGSILKKKVVVSAAHCFIPSKLSFIKYCTGRLDTKHYRTTYVIAGNLQNHVRYSSRRTAGQWRRISLINFPLSYHFPTDDIAVVHLTTPFNFDQYVGPIPHATKFKDYIGLHCLASGYGKTSSKSQSYNLQKAFLEIMPMRTCNRVFGQRMSKFVCTIDRVTNVLQGDSGGPLVCTKTEDPAEKDKGVLVGIVSGGAPGRGTLFTRVSSFKKFIARGKAVLTRPTLKYLLVLIWIIIL